MERTLSPRVAVVRSHDRRAAVAEAMALIRPEIEACVADRVFLKPNCVSHKVQLPSTHADTLSAVVDSLLAAGAGRITVAEGASDARAAFDRFGYLSECWSRPVDFLDLNQDEADWEPLELVACDGSTTRARVSRAAATSECRVSLALMKTHVTAMLTLSLKNMLSCIHPDDRVKMHGSKGVGNGYTGAKRLIVEFLKQDNAAVRLLTRGLGRARGLRNRLRGIDRPGGFARLTPADLAFLRTVEAMNRNLVRLNQAVKPHLSVVDGFVAMHREGPRHGTPARLGVVVAGTDAVAVDAVSAAVMGFDPSEIGYLAYADSAGLGTIDLDRIDLVGDPIEVVRRRMVPHSNHGVQRHWSRLDKSTATVPTPHVRPSGACEVRG